MKASRGLQIDFNIAFGKIPFETFFAFQADYRAQGLSSERCRWDTYYKLVSSQNQRALQLKCSNEGLNDDHLDTLLRLTVRDVFGPKEWSACK